MLIVDVNGCQRCGKDHEQLVFQELTNPADEWKWWALCPLTKQPVLLLVEDDGNQVG